MLARLVGCDVCEAQLNHDMWRTEGWVDLIRCEHCQTKHTLTKWTRTVTIISGKNALLHAQCPQCAQQYDSE